MSKGAQANGDASAGVSTRPAVVEDDVVSAYAGRGTLASAETFASHVASCPECGEILKGEYCHRCGEKRLEGHDLSVRHFFHEAVQELTSVEHSKLFHTVWAILFRPGFLTNEWIAGRRKRYLKPLNLCLGIFALSIFAYSVYKPVSMYDLGNVLAQDKTGRAMIPLNRLAVKKHLETDVLLDRVSEKWQRLMSLSGLLFIAGFALVLQTVFMFSRRYFVEHLVFSMHFYSFSLLSVVLLWPIYFFIGIKSGGINTWVSVLKWLLDIVYMYFAVRAVYRLSAARTILASLLLIAGYFLSYVLIFIGTLAVALVSVAMAQNG
ncbi:MAG: hypothetical protein QOH51_170 [Acidobacteriota bacterium]|jgi:hypothetical protein|nr:hypothetical protein [Acidobacteriota bacterium]